MANNVNPDKMTAAYFLSDQSLVLADVRRLPLLPRCSSDWCLFSRFPRDPTKYSFNVSYELLYNYTIQYLKYVYIRDILTLYEQGFTNDEKCTYKLEFQLRSRQLLTFIRKSASLNHTCRLCARFRGRLSSKSNERSWRTWWTVQRPLAAR